MKKYYIFNCDCGCGKLEFEELDGYLYISHYVSSFYEKQQPILETIKNRLKMIWCAISGKEFRLYDILLNEEESKNFKSFCNTLGEEDE